MANGDGNIESMQRRERLVQSVQLVPARTNSTNKVIPILNKLVFLVENKEVQLSE